MNHISHSVARGDSQTDSAKLASLLALAAGAVALPQSGHADIIYTNMTSSPVVVGEGFETQFLFDVPGAVDAGFRFQNQLGYTQPGSLPFYYKFVQAGDLNGIDTVANGIRGNGNGIALAKPSGASWDQGVLYYNIPVGVVDDLAGRNPTTGYDRQYLSWFFEDSTQPGNLYYGWVEVSLSLATYNLGGPSLTIWGYAYDNTGAKPTMGQMPVPEPSSGALFVMGAMALGARGLRQWRQKREAARQS